MPRTGARRQQNEADLYAGRWIARLGGRIIAQGGTPQQARLSAIASRSKEMPEIVYQPTDPPLSLSAVLDEFRPHLPPDIPIYLVGGSVRDSLLNRPLHDFDFAVPEGAFRIARMVADALKAAYFPLDAERETARVLRPMPDGSRQVLDFALLRGSDLETDLAGRDFTINAMAVDVRRPDELLDPTGGFSDLRAGRLRACSPAAFHDDPLRILRGVRLAAGYSFRIQPETLQYMRKAAPALGNISMERMRDELFRILDGPQVSSAMRALEMLGTLGYFLPEMDTLKGVAQSPPHRLDVWEHTLDVLRRLEMVLGVLAPQYDPQSASSLALGLVSIRLGRFRGKLSEHLNIALNPDRSRKSLLYLAALYHDVGKPATRTIAEDGRVRFLGHPQRGAELAQVRGIDLRLNGIEADTLSAIVMHHMRPHHLVETGQPPTAKAIYRFFRDLGPAGVDVCLLSLADSLATYGAELPQELWGQTLDVCRTLLEAWWEKPGQAVSPPALLNGNDLMAELDISPGRFVGELLEAIREAQAAGEVHNRAEALDLARSLLP